MFPFDEDIEQGESELWWRGSAMRDRVVPGLLFVGCTVQVEPPKGSTDRQLEFLKISFKSLGLRLDRAPQRVLGQHVRYVKIHRYVDFIY